MMQTEERACTRAPFFFFLLKLERLGDPSWNENKALIRRPDVDINQKNWGRCRDGGF